MASNRGTWALVDRAHKVKVWANQGLTTVVAADGTTSVLYRGDWSIPDRLKSQGWVHIGDPDSAGGYIFDPYQADPGSTSKMYDVTTPTGEYFDYVHPLESDELFNNSY